MVYLKSMENAITLGELIGLLFLFCLPLLSILFLKTKRNDLARPVMGTIFLVYGLSITCWQRHKCIMASTKDDTASIYFRANPKTLALSLIV